LVKDRSNILIVCHGFPPNPGVSGRRWAKFAKYLKRNDHNVFVLASENVKPTESEWNKDIENINVEYLPYRFPKVISLNKPGFFNKIKYRFWLFILKNLNRGNFYDRSFFWKKQITKKVSHYIETKKINTVIVTAGPFFLSYYVTVLKNKYPHVKFIVDFRDLWTGDSEITSFSSLNAKRVEHEKFFERRTIMQSDYILTVGEKMSDYFNSLAINKEVYTLPNGYDEDDFKDLDIETENNQEGLIKLVFAGTLYINLDYILIPFFEALYKVKREDPELFKRLRFEFYGTFPESYKGLIDYYKLNEIIYSNARLPLNEVYSKIKNATACMLFLNDVYNFALSTKFCEYISQNKKIIVVSNKGQTAEFITSNQLGYWISPQNAYSDLLKCLNEMLSGPKGITNSKFDISYYSLNNLTKSLIEIIDKQNFSKVPCYRNKSLLMTFDYELFLGARSGTVINSIIIPTDKILKLLRNFKLKNAIFFVDTTYIKRLEENLDNTAIKIDYDLIIGQLTEMVKDGHFIFPHIHPHWVDAEYDPKINQWRLNDLSKYRFAAISDTLKVELFEFSINFIKKMQAISHVSYEIDSFRAGGWCIQPFSDFRNLFEKYNIKNDFSVLRGFSMDAERFFYNFENVPERPIYYFDGAIESAEVTGKYKEYAISYINTSNFKKILSRIINRVFIYSGVKSLGDGVSVDKTEESIIMDASFNLSLKKNIKEMVSIDFLNRIKVNDYKNFLKSNNYIHFISHPKMVSENSLMNFSNFLRDVKKKYDIETDYKKMF
jgi:hypothetical protein